MRAQNPGVGAGQVALSKSVVALSAADILALSTTPKVLVPAPGAGKVVSVISFAILTQPTVTGYQGNGGDQLDVFYSGQATDLVDPTTLSGIVNTLNAYFSSAQPGTSAIVDPLAAYANLAVVLSGPNYAGGPVLTTSLGAGGTGYVVNDTGYINAGGLSCTYKVLTVGGGGAVLTYQITNAGTNYNVGNGQATHTGGAQPGVGINFTINILTVQNGTGTLKCYTYYDILPTS